MVLGDSLGEGLYAGMYKLLKNDKHVKLLQLSKIGTGLYHLQMEKWLAKLDQIVAEYHPDIALVWTGGNDPQPILDTGRKRYAFKSDKWQELYVERVNQFMTSLTSRNIRTFWTGLPVMRQDDYNRDIQYLKWYIRRMRSQARSLFSSPSSS